MISAKTYNEQLAKNRIGGLTRPDSLNIKRSDRYCPRCYLPTVNKAIRRCVNPECMGRLLWQGDSTEYFDSRRDYYYMWLKNITGHTGWFAASYVRNQH